MHSDPMFVRVGSTRERSLRTTRNVLVLIGIVSLVAGTLQAASLRGSRSSLHRQNAQARQHNYSYLRTGAQVRHFAEKGYLVPVRSNENFELASVSFPYARPEVELFLNRLGRQYRAACGEKIVVTSLTRPTSRQPQNASPLSVHPTGMAMDLRLPQESSCRSWLEGTLLSLEKAGILEATRERRPPHYHVALYPNRYADYVEKITGRSPDTSTPSSGGTYTVRSGDTLWEIARDHNTTVASLKQANGMRSAMIKPGQKLRIP